MRSVPVQTFPGCPFNFKRRAARSPAPSCINLETAKCVDMLEEAQNPGYTIPEVDPEVFVRHLLPPLRDGLNVEDVESPLVDEGVLTTLQTWKAAISSKKTKAEDSKSFTPLRDLFERAAALASKNAPHIKEIVQMAFLPSRPKRASRRKLPPQRAYFTLKKDSWRYSAGRKPKKNGTYTWFDVALTAEFKKNNTPEARKDVRTDFPQSIKQLIFFAPQNARNIIRNIQQVMARDPSRRFSFGITVEHTNMRLWFCSRGTPVVSKSFDFMTVCPLPLPHVWVINSAEQNLPLLLHVFLSLAFASKEALGWDPTVQLVTVKGGKRVYRIDVGGQTYETKEVLSDDVAEELVGHATRVWTVSRPGSDELFVLKDVWVEDGSSLEHAINETILRDAEIRYGTSVRNELASHLLTPVASWLVSFNGEEDHTTNVMMRGYSPSFRDIVKVDVRRLRTANNDGTAIVSSTPRYSMRAPFPWHNPARQVLGRKHYRIVFKEVARAIDAIERPADVFVVLSDTAKGAFSSCSCERVRQRPTHCLPSSEVDS